MNGNRVRYLCNQFLAEQCSPDELAELQRIVAEDKPETKAILREVLGDVWSYADVSLNRDLDPDAQDLIFNKIVRRARTRPRVMIYWPYAAAVLAVLLVSAFYLRLFERWGPGDELVRLEMDTHTDIQPGGNKATLMLADGERIALDEIEIGTTITTDALRITKATDGSLVYESLGHRQKEGNEGRRKRYNVVSTPRGGQYRVLLSDGTTVTLNAESWLRYPEVFDSDTRDVEVWGEAYFDVKKDTERPFCVLTKLSDGFQRIEVVGTQFNINSYNEEKIRTTVLEGEVRVKNGRNQTVGLIAGQQSIWSTADQKKIEVVAANALEIAAWKDGLFMFDGESIVDILARLSRWYDVEFECEPGVDMVTFQGNYFRDRGLMNLLRNLEMTDKILFLVDRNDHSIEKERRIHVVLKDRPGL